MSNMLMVELNEDTMVHMDGKDYAVVPVESKDTPQSPVSSIGLLCLIAYVAVKAAVGLSGLTMWLIFGFCLCMAMVVGNDLLKSINTKLEERKIQKAQEPTKEQRQKAS